METNICGCLRRALLILTHSCSMSILKHPGDDGRKIYDGDESWNPVTVDRRCKHKATARTPAGDKSTLVLRPTSGGPRGAKPLSYH